jgi:hypothetical protein
VPPGLSTGAANQICTECRTHCTSLSLPCKLRIHTHTLIAPPQFPRHGTQHNGIQSTAEAMAVVTTFHPHLLRWGAVPVRHRCRDVRTAGPGAWHLRHGLYVSTSLMLHSQISLTEPSSVCMVCDTIDRGISFLYANSSAWGSASLGCTFNIIRLPVSTLTCVPANHAKH